MTDLTTKFENIKPCDYDKVITGLQNKLESAEKVIDAAKTVNWRNVLSEMPRVIWWRYEWWINYEKFEKFLEEYKH